MTQALKDLLLSDNDEDVLLGWNLARITGIPALELDALDEECRKCNLTRGLKYISEHLIFRDHAIATNNLFGEYYQWRPLNETENDSDKGV